MPGGFREAVSSSSTNCSVQNLLCVKAAFACAAENAAAFCLDAQATERMLEALQTHTERDFHVKDYIRAPEDKPGKGKPVDLRATGWLTLIREQLGLTVRRQTEKK